MGSLSSNVFERCTSTGRQGWRSGESAHLPPVWPEFKSRLRLHMWVEFVVGSLPCSERIMKITWREVFLFVVVIVTSILLKTTFSQISIHSQLLVKILQRSDKDKITFERLKNIGMVPEKLYRNTLIINFFVNHNWKKINQ